MAELRSRYRGVDTIVRRNRFFRGGRNLLSDKLHDCVTAVVTSCRRQDLLEIALTSFFKHNTYPFIDVIVVEDGDGNHNRKLADKFKGQPIVWIATRRRIGQIQAIDFAYAGVTTPYIFHMEDDWEFYTAGFIEKSLQILRLQPTCLQVKIQALDDLNGHPLDERREYAADVSFRRLLPDYSVSENGQSFVWNGFSFNPGLRRLSDYRKLGSYAVHCISGSGSALRCEEVLGKYFRNIGFHTVVLADNDENGYVRHIGADRHVGDPLSSRVKHRFQNWWKYRQER